MAVSIKQMLRESNAVIACDHFVYKKGTHGKGYIDKEKFSLLGARKISAILRSVAEKAIKDGLQVGQGEMIGVIGPAYGAIPYALTVAESFEKHFGSPLFFPARTELSIDASGNKIHVIPEKLIPTYTGKMFIGVEDIVNNGTTICELRDLLLTIKSRLVAAVSVADRGGQTAESLGIEQYFPALRVDMEQVDPREQMCPDCAAGIPINTKLGKGARWVKLFGQPPYLPGMDFSAFWNDE